MRMITPLRVHIVRRVVVSINFWVVVDFGIHFVRRLLVVVGRISDWWSSYREKGCREHKFIDVWSS